jgi:mannose-1-phosphate guanylyltransferase
LKALILAGGFGTRLRPLSCTRPKILFPIVNKPLLQWTFERLARNGVNEIIMAVNYQTEVAIKQHRIPKHGLHVTYSRDPLRKPLGTGGPIKKAEKRMGHDSPFLVLNGDIFADVNYTEILRAHQRKNPIATIALCRVKDPSQYGVAELAEDDHVKRFIEKAPRETAPSNLINAGVYVLNPEIFNYIPKSRKVSIEYEVFPKLAEEGLLYGHVHEGLWMDIGKPEDYLEINRTLINSATPQPTCRIGKETKLKEPTAFDKHVSVGRKSVIGPHVVLGQNVTVGNNVHIQDSVILSGTAVSDFALIDGAIIGEGVFIGENAKIGKGCMIGDYARIKDNTSLTGRVLVCPAKEVSESILTSKCIT